MMKIMKTGKITTSFINKLIFYKVQNTTSKPVLGRWKLEDCNTKMNHKIDLSNEDHCGPCGQYALDKIEKIEKGIKDIQT